MDSVTQDSCAFIVSRVYESYNGYIDMLIDTVVAKDAKLFSKEFEKALAEAKE